MLFTEGFITGTRSRLGRCFLWGDSSHIVPTAWLVSLLGDSSAFLKAMSQWLGPLFSALLKLREAPWERRCLASRIPQVDRSERPLGNQGQRTRWMLQPTSSNNPLPASYNLLAYWSSLLSIIALGMDYNWSAVMLETRSFLFGCSCGLPNWMPKICYDMKINTYNLLLSQ